MGVVPLGAVGLVGREVVQSPERGEYEGVVRDDLGNLEVNVMLYCMIGLDVRVAEGSTWVCMCGDNAYVVFEATIIHPSISVRHGTVLELCSLCCTVDK